MIRRSWLAAAVVAAFFAAAVLWVRPFPGGGVCAGVAVEGVEVGGMSREELRNMLSVWRQDYRSRHVVIYYGDMAFRLEAAAIDYDLDVEATVEEAYGVGRRGPWADRVKNAAAARREGYRIPVRVRYNESKLSACTEAWREVIDRPPSNAAFSLFDEGIVPAEQGRRLQTEEVRPLIVEALRSCAAANVALPVRALYPEVTVADVRQSGINSLWASFTTVFDAAEANRTANIRLAARRINGFILHPGQVFSFNAVVGPRDREHGFREALEIVDGEFVAGIGGGVCQVSSTLYNAALLAGLAVQERTNHSKPLGYVGLGRDATVVYGALDLKFVNDTASPVMVLAETVQNRLKVGIVGRQPLGVTVDIVSADRRVLRPAVVKKQDPELYLGETRVDRQGKPGYEVTTVRVVRSANGEVRREVLSKDRYLPENTIVKVGAKLPPFAREGGGQNGEIK